MRTLHQLSIGDARRMRGVKPESVALVVTSPPYPMVQMWDEAFAAMSDDVRRALEAEDAPAAMEAMHRVLDPVWQACHRVVMPGGFVCINVGDAVRTQGGLFRRHANAARITAAMEAAGFVTLPDILWRKPTNAPNKFMGSGMLPAGAYVTYEHEYILVFRKGDKRSFPTAEERLLRQQSAFFWEERNQWFSDMWSGLVGCRQDLGGGRERSAAFPFELAWRLIQMYSLLGDTVLDPFVGTGTTMAAALASGRSSRGVEIDASLSLVVARSLRGAVAEGQERAQARLAAHEAFVEGRTRPWTHSSSVYGFPVMTRQERELTLFEPVSVSGGGPLTWAAEHRPARLLVGQAIAK